VRLGVSDEGASARVCLGINHIFSFLDEGRPFNDPLSGFNLKCWGGPLMKQRSAVTSNRQRRDIQLQNWCCLRLS